jgi:hypothetical protein
MHSTNSFPVFFLVLPQHSAASHAAAATRTRTLRNQNFESFYCCAWGADCVTGGDVHSWQFQCTSGIERRDATAGCCRRKSSHSHHPRRLGRMKTVASLQVRAPAAPRPPPPPTPANIHFPARLQGHGRSINDLRFLPSDPNMLLSCSSDESCRLLCGSRHSATCSGGGTATAARCCPSKCTFLWGACLPAAAWTTGADNCFSCRVLATAPHTSRAAFECGHSTVQRYFR